MAVGDDGANEATMIERVKSVVMSPKPKQFSLATSERRSSNRRKLQCDVKIDDCPRLPTLQPGRSINAIPHLETEPFSRRNAIGQSALLASYAWDSQPLSPQLESEYEPGGRLLLAHYRPPKT